MTICVMGQFTSDGTGILTFEYRTTGLISLG